MRRRWRPTHAESPVPGAEPPRLLPRIRYELIGCGLHGHELVGTTAGVIRPDDWMLVRELDGLRWHRCLRCDSWIPSLAPLHPARETVPETHEIELPLRGRPLRDRYVLRLIAIDRAIHFVVLGAIAGILFVLAAYHGTAHRDFVRVVNDLQGGTGGAGTSFKHGILHEFSRLFTVTQTHLYEASAGVAAYALLEGTEALGLWFAKRWAEYLTFVATLIFLPYEVWELTKSVSALKVSALVINLLIAGWLLWRKRLFGARGGRPADEAERLRDMGWQAIERSTPGTGLLTR